MEVKDKKPLTVEQRIRRLQKIRSVRLGAIDVELFEHVEQMMKASFKRLSLHIAPRFRAGYVASLYNLVMFGDITTAEHMDDHFRKVLRERNAPEEAPK